ncbi:hypothetical protein MUO98_05785 [Candidatus Bathyarchaeota archaeon]|nr:hypothetical protein [Candidatus Bathyarchaeota archaeon]
MKHPKFSKEVEGFLGKYVIQQCAHDYSISHQFRVKCEDGRIFEEEMYGYGMSTLESPYKQSVYKKLEQKIKDSMMGKLPYMDRKMRQT